MLARRSEHHVLVNGVRSSSDGMILLVRMTERALVTGVGARAYQQRQGSDLKQYSQLCLGGGRDDVCEDALLLDNDLQRREQVQADAS